MDWVLAERKAAESFINGSVSDWSLVKSGVPQGSVLGPLLYLIFISDLDDGIGGIILKFADYTKFRGKVGKIDEIEKLRGDLKKLAAWSKEWQMVFNADKCKVLHFGHNNGQVHYAIDGNILECVEEKRDLWVIIQSNLKVDKQCAKAARTANSVLGMIGRSFIIKLYILFRPIQVSCSS